MPYTADSAPARIKALPAKKQRQWLQVFNSAYNRAKGAGKSDSEAEASAFAQANGVVKDDTAAANHSANFEWAPPGPPPPPLFLHEDTGTVYRGGVTFVPGDFPDKAYAMTPAEIIEAAERFTDPQPIDLEHIATVLDPDKKGHLGEVVALEAADDGSELKGLVAMPKWLDDRIGATPRKISASWNRQTKRLEGLALVLNPRIPHAALMAAFTEANGGSMSRNPNDADPTAGAPAPGFAVDPNVGGGVDRDKLPDGDFAGKNRTFPIDKPGDVSDAAASIGRAGPDNHDGATLKANIIRIAKRKGAAYVAELPEAWRNENANASLDLDIGQLRTIADFAIARHDTSEGRGQLQLVHDVSARGGAVCNQPADMASRHEADALQQIHNLSTEHGAQCSAAGSNEPRPSFNQPGRRASFMSGIRDRWNTFWSQVPEQQLAELLPDGGAPPASNTTTAPPTPPAAVAQAVMTAAAVATAPAHATGESDGERGWREKAAAFEAENRRIRAERIAEQAAQFADHFVKGTHQAFPVQRDAIINAYINCATVDLLLPGTATFGDGKPSTMVSILKAVLDSAPQNQLTAEQLAPGIFAALANKDQTTSDAAFATSDKPLTPDQVTDLIRRTTLGQSVLDHAARGGVATTNGINRTN